MVVAWANVGGPIPTFEINESASMGVCDAVAVAEITPLWRYVKHELNTLVWAILIVVTFLLARRLCALLRLLVMGSRLPGPPARALNGQSKCLSAALEPQMLQDLLARLHQKHGPVVRLWTGPAQLLVSIKDVRILQRMLELANDRVPAPRMALQLVFGQRNLFFSKFSKASQSRLILEKEVNGRLLREAHGTLVKVAESVMRRCARPARNGTWEVDCMTFARRLAFAALGTSLYGDGYLTSRVACEFEEVTMEVSEEVPTWMPYCVPPLWNCKFNEFRTKCRRLQALGRQLVANGNQTGLLLEDSEDVGDDSVLVALGSAMGIEYGSVSEPQATAGIMSHGFANIAGVLHSVLAQLAYHPHIQAKVHDEILTMSGAKNPPTESDLRKMTFLTASVREAARLLPTASFLQRCSVDRDVELHPRVTIPAGAILAAPVQLIHQDETYWGEDANSFNPDRFLKTSNVLTAERKRNHDLQKCVTEHPSSGVLELNPGFLVFGAGSRSCIGSSLALKQSTTLVAVILQRFELKNSDHCFQSSEGRTVLSLSPR